MPMMKCPGCHRTVNSWGRICPKCGFEVPKPEDIGRYKTGEQVQTRDFAVTVVREGRREIDIDGKPIGPRLFWVRMPDGSLTCLPEHEFMVAS